MCIVWNDISPYGIFTSNTLTVKASDYFVGYLSNFYIGFNLLFRIEDCLKFSAWEHFGNMEF